MAAQPVTAAELANANAFLDALGAPRSTTNQGVVVAWMRQETGSGTTGVGLTQNNLLGITDGHGHFLSYPTQAASMVDAARLIKGNAPSNYAGEGPILTGFLSQGPDATILAISQSGWDGTHYGLNALAGLPSSHLYQTYINSVGGSNFQPGTLSANAQDAVGAAGGVVAAAVAPLAFAAQAAAFVADPQNWLRLGALFLGLILTGAGGYILWQAT